MLQDFILHAPEKTKMGKTVSILRKVYREKESECKLS